MNERRCDKCEWWGDRAPYPAEEGLAGYCHRNAPIAVLTRAAAFDKLDASVIWPITLSDDWCGEFSPAKATEGAG